MKNTFLKFIIILGSASVFFAVFLAFHSGQSGELNLPKENFSASISQVVAPPEGPRILIQTANGGVWVNNFYKNSAGYSPELNAILLKKTREYEIRYYRNEGSFEIKFSVYATAKSELETENSLFGILGVGKSDLCRLDIAITDPYSADSRPLSFCGSVLLNPAPSRAPAPFRNYE